jgi:hypothetical protein
MTCGGSGCRNAPGGAPAPAQGADGGGREGAAALAHLRDTALQLRELAHVQLLADSYRAAQRRAFGAASPPPVRPLAPTTR